MTGSIGGSIQRGAIGVGQGQFDAGGRAMGRVRCGGQSQSVHSFLLRSQLKQGGPAEHLLETVLGLFKQRAERAALPTFTVGNFTQASLEGDLPVDRFDDFQDRDLIRGSGQGEPAPCSTLGTQDACFRQILEDLGQEAFRDRNVAADGVDHDGLPRRLPNQVQQSQDPVFACSRDMHELNQTKSVRLLLLVARNLPLSTRGFKYLAARSVQRAAIFESPSPRRGGGSSARVRTRGQDFDGIRCGGGQCSGFPGRQIRGHQAEELVEAFGQRTVRARGVCLTAVIAHDLEQALLDRGGLSQGEFIAAEESGAGEFQGGVVLAG